MVCCWSLYEDYQNILAGKIWIINIERKNEAAIIKIVSNEFSININGELKILNGLYKTRH